MTYEVFLVVFLVVFIVFVVVVVVSISPVKLLDGEFLEVDEAFLSLDFS